MPDITKMPYISSSGEIKQNQPWGLSRIISMFWDTVNFFYIFFRTLLPIGNDSSNKSQDRSRYQGPKPPRPPRGFRTMSDVAPPPCFGGT